MVNPNESNVTEFDITDPETYVSVGIQAIYSLGVILEHGLDYFSYVYTQSFRERLIANCDILLMLCAHSEIVTERMKTDPVTVQGLYPTQNFCAIVDCLCLLIGNVVKHIDKSREFPFDAMLHEYVLHRLQNITNFMSFMFESSKHFDHSKACFYVLNKQTKH